jgi:hypothetical protein
LPELIFGVPVIEIPRRSMRDQPEGALNGYRLLYRLATALLLAGGLFLLAGCQALKGDAPGSVQLGTANLNFGTVVINTAATLGDTITNNTTSSVTIASVQGLTSEFQVTGLTLPITLAAGQATSFSVVFQPTAVGNPTITISFDDQNSQPIVSLPTTGVGATVGTLLPNPSQLIFGNVVVGSTQSKTVALSNSGGTPLNINQATLSGAGFTMSNLPMPMTLQPGGETSATITFAPPSTGNFTGSITFATTSDGVSNNVAFNLAGAGVSPGTLAPSPSSLAFGSIQVGTKTSLSETLTNTGGSTVTISAATPSGTGFSISGLTLPLNLTAGQSVTFTATFTPTNAGAASGSISVVSNASNSPLAIALSGTGTAAGTLAVSPTSLAFGNVNVGSSSALGGSLIASGAAVTVNSASSNSSEFVLSGISFPVTIPAGQSSTFTVTFTPQSSGAASASLSFTSNASNSPAVQSLTGTGVTATQHTVDLTWTASSGAVGYNIYRGTVSGGPYTMINSSLDSTIAYTDSTVTSGTTYYYVATAVNSGSEESGYSNQATAVIPTP